MEKRVIREGHSAVQGLDVDPAQTLRDWLASAARQYGLCWLLAYTDSGVIWGKNRDAGLALSCEAFPRPGLALEWGSLHSCRLFGPDGEIIVWRDGERWWASLRRDDREDGAPVRYFDEEQLLWGNSALRDDQGRAEVVRDGFRLVMEGAQGIVQVLPIGVAPAPGRRARLCVRQYLREDEAGVVALAGQRLVALREPGEQQEGR
jgi:CRISPR-associated protein (TIGR03984 family)